VQSIIRLLNSCPRLTHLSLTGVAAFQREDFHPFCRTAPPGTCLAAPAFSWLLIVANTLKEFTPHQRDVFCVFSGGMVTSFRHFLNTDPQFEEFREPLPGSRRFRGGPPRRTGSTNAEPAQEGEGFDDEMADEDNDFDPLDHSEMAMDAQNNTLPPIDANAQAPTILPSITVHIGPVPPVLGLPGQATGHAQFVPQHTVGSAPQLSPVAYSSFLTSQPANGEPPLNALGHTQASLATGGSSRQASSTTTPAASGGASTASMSGHDGPNGHDGGDSSRGAMD
jgi:F-box and leucine-rich repeat protein GRR1